jgi:hypothetical protein
MGTLAVLALAVLAVVVLSACGNSAGSDRPCAAPFNTDKWKRALKQGSHHQRLSLAEDVVRCRYVKRGNSKSKVARVLGRPKRDELQSRDEYASEWLYYLGMTNNAGGPGDDQFLFVDFSGGRVTRVTIDPR